MALLTFACCRPALRIQTARQKKGAANKKKRAGPSTLQLRPPNNELSPASGPAGPQGKPDTPAPQAKRTRGHLRPSRAKPVGELAGAARTARPRTARSPAPAGWLRAGVGTPLAGRAAGCRSVLVANKGRRLLVVPLVSERWWMLPLGLAGCGQ
jgi:hypothetical protein